jgi:hypothetical protein
MRATPDAFAEGYSPASGRRTADDSPGDREKPTIP